MIIVLLYRFQCHKNYPEIVARRAGVCAAVAGRGRKLMDVAAGLWQLNGGEASVDRFVFAVSSGWKHSILSGSCCVRLLRVTFTSDTGDTTRCNNNNNHHFNLKYFENLGFCDFYGLR